MNEECHSLKENAMLTENDATLTPPLVSARAANQWLIAQCSTKAIEKHKLSTSSTIGTPLMLSTTKRKCVAQRWTFAF
jgi:hypothetical protein